jgi:glycosyltransferase involved in cell wall biosynthesis
VKEPFPQDVILFSTADWDHPFWTNKQHTAVGLAGRGFRILYVESLGLRRPSTERRDLSRLGRRLLKGMRGLRQVQERIWVYSPLAVPLHGRRWVRSSNTAWVTTSVRRSMRRLGFRHPIVWTYNPLTVAFMGRFDASLWVYHCVDDLTAAPHMPRQPLAVAEQALVRRADLIFTSSPALQTTRSRWNPQHTHYLPNVADFDHFSKALQPGPLPDDLRGLPSPRIGFIGAISDYKLDFELIATVADCHRDWQWVMIGPVGEGQPGTSVSLLRKPNIHLLGPRPYDVLPDYLRGFDVAVLPCRLNAYTTAMFPMKFFEYLAAGRSVVSTDLPALQTYADACVLARNGEEFAAALAEVLAGGGPDRQRGPVLAREHTWDKRLDCMQALLLSVWQRKMIAACTP